MGQQFVPSKSPNVARVSTAHHRHRKQQLLNAVLWTWFVIGLPLLDSIKFIWLQQAVADAVAFVFYVEKQKKEILEKTLWQSLGHLSTDGPIDLWGPMDA